MTFRAPLLNLQFAFFLLGFQIREVEAQRQNRGVANSRQEQEAGQIGKGDRLSFRIAEDEEGSRILTVSDSGQVRVPYLGTMTASGKTTQTLAQEIKRKLEQSFYKKATVILSLDKQREWNPGRTGRVYLTGEVAKPGAIDLPESLTVSRVILLAGGFSDFANKRKVRLIHKSGGTEKTEIIDVLEVLEKGRTDLDKPVSSGDVIIVPARLINW